MFTVVLSSVNTTYSKRRKIAIPKRQKEGLFSGNLLQRKDHTAAGVQRSEHGRGGLLLAGHLRMAVGAFQKTGVAVTGQLRHRLLVDAAVQQGGDEKVPHGVQMVLGREAVGSINLPQAFCKCVRVNERSVRVDKQIGTEFSAMSCRLLRQPPAVTEQHNTQGGGENDLPTVTVFGAAFYDTFARHNTAGAADGENESVAAGAEVRPAQSAQLAATTAGGHGQQIEHAEVSRLSGEGLQQMLCFFDGGNVLVGV